MQGKHILIAADHAGFALKDSLSGHLRALGHHIEDLGNFVYDETDDYPDYILPLARKIAGNQTLWGVIIGGSGQGEAMCANRVKGARAAVFYGKMSAVSTLEVEGGRSEDGYDGVRLARRHNDANILSLGARFLPVEDALEAVRIFLETPFTGGDRHARRLAKF